VTLIKGDKGRDKFENRTGQGGGSRDVKERNLPELKPLSTNHPRVHNLKDGPDLPDCTFGAAVGKRPQPERATGVKDDDEGTTINC